MAAGQFVLKNPVFLIGLLQTICAGLIPRQLLRLPWEMLLGFLAPIICWVTAAEHDGIAAKAASERFAGLWQGR
jgi:hypothetical protein